MPRNENSYNKLQFRKRGKKTFKIGQVLREFAEGSLASSSGQQVTDKRQALAIALSEAGYGKKKKK